MIFVLINTMYMEIKEILSYYVDTDTNVLDVSFRTINDNDDVVRWDKIDYTTVSDYGFELVTESFDFFDEDDEDENIKEDEVELDVDELINFLNEYYMVNPHSIPKADFF
jgi:hypothetical protein